MKKLIPIIILCLLSSCRNKLKMDKEYHSIYRSTEKRFSYGKKRARITPIIDDKTLYKEYKDGISLDQAIGIALENNPALQSKFEQIGIAKADLVQAGFFSNPRLETICKIPKKGERTNVEVDLQFTLSDFWQIPFRKQLAQEELEIQSHRLVQFIIDIITQVKMDYHSAQYHKHYYYLTKKITDNIRQLRERIYYRHQFGYSSELDMNLADVRLGQWENRAYKALANLQQAYTNLRNTLGITINAKAITLTDPFKLETNIPSVEFLDQYVHTTNPLIRMAQITVEQARNAISFERARIFDNVTVGISYERDFDKTTKGAGPTFGLDIPLFDTNFGNIERAKLRHLQTKHEQTTIEFTILRQLYTTYNHYQALLKEIVQYKQKIIPASKKAIKYTKEYFDQMQINLLIVFETQLAMYETQVELLMKIHEAMHTYAMLEQAVGTSISNIKKV